MSALAAILLTFGAIMGLGGALTALLRLRIDFVERLGWAWVLGFGAFGWLIFFPGQAGLLHPLPLAWIMAAAVPGILFLRRGRSPPATPFSPWETTLAAMAFAAMALYLPEALNPPSDADSLAYHFALVKQFVLAGKIEFVPRAIDGAVPLLVQTTTIPVFALAGERGLTLWSAFSAWASALAVFALARPHLPRAWALALIPLLLTVPAVIYGGASGQVELRLAPLVLAALLAAGRALRGQGGGAWAAAAGLACGFVLAGKLTGLLLAGILGLPLLISRRRLHLVPIFSLLVLAAGSQWYIHNWVHTGDPIFPMLSDWLPYGDRSLWPADFQDWFRHWNDGELVLPRSPLHFLAYPFLAALAPDPAFEAGRVGFGPFLWLILPFAALGAWQKRARLSQSALAFPAAAALAFALIWFLFGPSQRLRHFLPLLPIIAIAGLAAALAWAGDDPRKRLLPAAALALTLLVQFAGQGFNAARHVHALVHHQSRDEFLAETVSYYEPVAWANAHLGPDDRILTFWRAANYLYDVPYYHAHPVHQALVDLRPPGDPARFWRQIRALGITHILILGEADRPPVPGESAGDSMTRRLYQDGCAGIAARLTSHMVASRAMALTGRPVSVQILRLQPGTCPLSR